MPYDEQLALQIRNALTPYHKHLVEKKMMGGLCIMYKGKMSCGVEKEDLIVRVIDSKYKESLKKPHCREMDFTGKVLSGFLYVDKAGIQTEKQLRFWLELGIEFVEKHGPKKKTMTKAERLFHQIAEELPNATKGKAFGAFCIKARNGKLAVLFWENNLMFKLDEKNEAEILTLKGTRQGRHIYATDRPMTGWVQVPFSLSSKWEGLAKKSLSYVMRKK